MYFSGRMDKEDVKGILLSHEKEILPAETTWLDVKVIMLSEIIQKEKDK